jgi:hypothetical protein
VRESLASGHGTFLPDVSTGGPVLEGYRLKDSAPIRTETALGGGIANATKRTEQEKR